MEELRVEFDTFEFLAASKKSSVLEHLYLKPFHRVLIPHVLHSLRMSRNYPKNAKKFRNAMRSLFNKSALENSKQNNIEESKRPGGGRTLENKLHTTFMKILSQNRIRWSTRSEGFGSSNDNQPESHFGVFGGLQNHQAKNPKAMLNSQPEEEENSKKGSILNPNPNYFVSFLKMASREKDKKKLTKASMGLRRASPKHKKIPKTYRKSLMPEFAWAVAKTPKT